MRQGCGPLSTGTPRVDQNSERPWHLLPPEKPALHTQPNPAQLPRGPVTQGRAVPAVLSSQQRDQMIVYSLSSIEMYLVRLAYTYD